MKKKWNKKWLIVVIALVVFLIAGICCVANILKKSDDTQNVTATETEATSENAAKTTAGTTENKAVTVDEAKTEITTALQEITAETTEGKPAAGKPATTENPKPSQSQTQSTTEKPKQTTTQAPVTPATTERPKPATTQAQVAPTTTERPKPAATEASRPTTTEAPRPATTQAPATTACQHNWVEQTVYHPAKTHVETWKESVYIGYHDFCNNCGMDLTVTFGGMNDAASIHIRNCGGGTGYTYKPVYDEVEKSLEVVDEPAYTEVTGYKCSKCGATK